MIWGAPAAIGHLHEPVDVVSMRPKTFAAFRTTTPPVVDGIIDDAVEWPPPAKFEGLVDTFRGEAAPEPAEFWLEYDAKFLYFAARLRDPVAKSIQSSEYRTNVSLEGEDSVELLISPSGNVSDFDVVQINPHGATNIEPAGGRALKREWLGEVSSKGRVTAKGWEVETRIPWTLFKMPPAGRHDMRFNVRRRMPRVSKVYSLAYTVAGHRADTPIWQGVMVPSIPVDHSIKALAYGYLGVDRGNPAVANAGLDLKTTVTDSVTLVGSINPDFRDVENPILSLDFSRFARLAGDNRPFFQEGAGYISSKILVSQKIPDFDLGLSAFGNIGSKTHFGLLDALTFGGQENFVASMTTSPDPQNIIAAAVTSVSKRGFENEASVVNWSHVAGGFRLAAVDSQTVDSNLGKGASDSVSLRYLGNGLISNVRLDRVTPNYLPGLGFQPEVDYEGGSANISYDQDPHSGPIITQGVFATGQSYGRLEGKFYRDSISTGVDVLLRNQLLLATSVFADRFDADKDQTFSLDAQYPNNDLRRQVSFDATAGMQAEQPYNSYTFKGTYAFGQRVSTTLGYQIAKLGTSYQEQAVWSWNSDLGQDRYVGGRMVQTTSGTNAYLSFHMSGNRGFEYFFIAGDPNAMPSVNRRYLVNIRSSLILKVVVPFQIGSSRGR